MGDRVTVRIDDGVADLRLDRPDKLNALDLAMMRALVESGTAVGADPSVRAVVLSGEGRAFCAGLDFGGFKSLAGLGKSERPEEPVEGLFDAEQDSPANLAQRSAFIFQEISVPVIAAIHGVAYGGGLQVAMAADIRFIAPDARMSIMEVNWGLVPDMSGTQTLGYHLRLDVIKELTFTGRIVDGAEAVALGLATHLSDHPRQDAMAMARKIAGRSPDAVRAAKRLLNRVVCREPAPGLRAEAEIQASLIGRPNQVEAVVANLEKRSPSFTDPD